MPPDTPPAPEFTSAATAKRPGNDRPKVLDIGAGDQEAPANAIPNIIADMVETETWRNAATVLMGALLIGLGYWAYQGLHAAIAENRAKSLERLLGTVVSAVDVWVGDHRAETSRLARERDVVAPATRIAAAARTPAAAAEACFSNDADDLVNQIRSNTVMSQSATIRLIDRGGVVIAAEDKAACGRRLRSVVFRQKLDLAHDGKPQFVRPYPDPELQFEDKDGRKRPLLWILAPVRAGDEPAVAVIAMGVFADREFARLFSPSSVIGQVDTYAFGDDGLLLTPSRWGELLAQAGEIADEFDAQRAFNIHVRDPGGDLSSGHRSRLEPAARPFTEPAALALASRSKASESERSGTVYRPYRDYTGVDTVGAWRWLAAYDIGVIAEIPAAEVFAPLRYLLISFSVIGGFTALTLLAALYSALSLSRLRRQFGRLQRLGAYTLEKQISEGGMATIWLARHALLKRPTAIKVLKKRIATDEFIHRFEREVQIASQLMHPNTVEIYDFGRTREGQPYYVMEYLEGVTLAELVADTGALPPGRAVHVLRQVAAALREAHQNGLVHRDVKPDNVMLCRRGEDDVVKLLDFGLVKNVEQEQTRDITKQLRVLGTPRYMAPERIVNPADVDARSDIYAWGAVAYFLLTGKPIFDGDSDLDLSNQALHRPAPRVSEKEPQVPEALDALIAACLEKDRARRPQSADAVIEALDRVASRLSWTASDASAWWTAFRERRRIAAAAVETARVSVAG
ncbi:eukaryotic-like serine/threonine-protein kinase [Burkholderiales bacterium]|nr:eukaryotic-like serine/threonine-protein kinase [Burkholderiales bacterium]